MTTRRVILAATMIPAVVLAGGHGTEPHATPPPAPAFVTPPVASKQDEAHADAREAADPHDAADAHAVDTHVANTVADAAPAESSKTSPDDAIRLLTDGNDRFVAGTPDRPHQDIARRCETFAGGQHPYAAILSCADSRVPVELIFDAGIGDLFVVRVAGNVAGTDEIGTIEYGVQHLGLSAIVVIGHGKCGAVTAVVDGADVTENIKGLVDNIIPAVEVARAMTPRATGAKLLQRAIKANVRRSMSDLLTRSDVIAAAVKSGDVKIVGGVYDLHTGEVEWLESSGPAIAGVDTQASPANPQAGIASAHVENEPDTHAEPESDESAPMSDEHAKSDPHAPVKSDPHAAPKSIPQSVTKTDARASVKIDPHAQAKSDSRSEPKDPANTRLKSSAASKSHATAHGSPNDDHATAQAIPHDADPHAAPATRPAGHETAAAPAARKDNYLALGGCLMVAFGSAYAFVHFLMPKTDAAPAGVPAAEAKSDHH